jgi:DNA polymerase-3 subunit delta
VTPKHVEAQIGISREYNIFELQKALGLRDVKKSSRIVNNFIANPKKNPLVMVVGTLFNYFSKVYMFHFIKNAPENEIMSKIGVRSGYILREYRTALKNYNYNKTVQVINILKEFDLKSKGVNYNSTGKPDGELLKEMIWQILH